jgi:hypothetical protein
MNQFQVGLAVVLGVATAVGMAGQGRPASGPFNATRGVALNGYDVVAYFEGGKPARGDAAFSYDWQDVTWRFATAARRDAFAKNPAAYAPQFGGFCAYGVSRGYAVDIDPEAWAIEGGKLYLNYSKSVQRTWNQDRPGYIAKAEAQWPTVAAKQSGK